MKPPIGPSLTVGALLEAYPEAEKVLIELAPAFASLRNPVLRRTVAKVATLEQAAKIGSISLRVMIEELRSFTGQPRPNEDVAPSPADDQSEIPDWVCQGSIVEEVDAAAMLQRGVHPIGKIREAVGELGPGELVRLRSPFRPQPLLDTMRQGSVRVYCTEDGQDHVAYFARA